MEPEENYPEEIESKRSLVSLLSSIEDKYAADVFAYNGTIDYEWVDNFIEMLRFHQNRRPNIFLSLTTYGGDPDAGYRLVKSIKHFYTGFVLFVTGSCKSTGTLIALGADTIVMGEFGEFGPLDIQLTKEDDLVSTSGLSYVQSLMMLNQQIFESFERNFLQIKYSSQNSITTKTAADIATNLAVGLVSPISAQLDPVKLGEVQRALAIAETYGQRLTAKKGLVRRLMLEYPSHSFVIDIDEAKEVFQNVVDFDKNDEKFEAFLKSNKLCWRPSENPQIVNLTDIRSSMEAEIAEYIANVTEVTPEMNGNPVASPAEPTAEMGAQVDGEPKYKKRAK